MQKLKLPGVARALAERVGDSDSELCDALGEAARLYPAIAESARAALYGDESHQLSGLRILSAAGLPIPAAVASALSASPLAEVRLAAAASMGATNPDAGLEDPMSDLRLGPNG